MNAYRSRMIAVLGVILVSGALAATIAHAASITPQAYLPMVMKAQNTPTPTATTAPTATPSGLLTAQEQQTLDLINGLRREKGCADLKAVSTLQNAAAAQSADMAATGNFSHTGSDGSTPATRATKYGYNWAMIGENIAGGYTTPESVVNAWKNSSGHYANIINCSYTDTGLSVKLSSNNTPYWTQDFGKPQ